jgi:Transposase DDE domain
MHCSAIESEWLILARYLPENWRDLARTHGALRRARGIKDADTLLRLILLHVAAGLSLRQTVVRAKNAGLARVTDVALLKRLKVSEKWLRTMTEHMLKQTRYCQALNRQWGNRRVRVIDATNVQEPGATGTSWRVHYGLQLPSLECDFFEVTDATGGESFKRMPVQSRDLVLGDRGYAHREGVAHIVHNGGDAIVRLNHKNFPLLDRTGEPFGFLQNLRTLHEYEPGEWDVEFDASGKRIAARVCAVRKSPDAAQKAKDRLIKTAKKKGKTVAPDTLEAAEYIFVLTTLPSAEASSTNVLELYRARWQIELAFKRLKSLLQAGHVPKYDAASARAWIQAKLLTVLLIERLTEEARFFSPWGFPLITPKSLA